MLAILLLLSLLITACGDSKTDSSAASDAAITNWELARVLLHFSLNLPFGSDDRALACSGGGTDTRTSMSLASLNTLAACRLTGTFSDTHAGWYDLLINGAIVVDLTDFDSTKRLSVGAADPLRINGWISRDGTTHVPQTDRACAFAVDVDASITNSPLPLAGIACDEALGSRTAWK
jgi:hypothetical protein